MSDPVDTDLANRMRASLHLIEQAREWERVALDQCVEREVRVKAALYARAIRTEIRP